jgi:hypothetical protein
MRSNSCAIVLALACAPLARAGIESLDAVDQGWYANTGIHNPSLENYITGFSDGDFFNSFFVFDLSAIEFGPDLLSAELILWNPGQGYVSTDPFETVQFYDVQTDLTALLDGSGGTAAFDDLGTGTLFGQANVTDSVAGSFVLVTLNTDALADIVASSDGLWAVGGTLSTISLEQEEEFVFGATGLEGLPAPELVLNFIPAPAAFLMLLGGVGLHRRHRRG